MSSIFALPYLTSPLLCFGFVLWAIVPRPIFIYSIWYHLIFIVFSSANLYFCSTSANFSIVPFQLHELGNYSLNYFHLLRFESPDVYLFFRSLISTFALSHLPFPSLYFGFLRQATLRSPPSMDFASRHRAPVFFTSADHYFCCASTDLPISPF